MTDKKDASSITTCDTSKGIPEEVKAVKENHSVKEETVEIGKKRSFSALEENDENDEHVSKFGSRLLSNDKDVFSQNAWDHVEWDEEQEKQAKEKIAIQLQNPVPEEEKERYFTDPAEYWNKFYEKNENRFFKDRNWLKIEFPELFKMNEAGAGKKRVFEIGCGAGNTMYPLLANNDNPDLFVYAADYSKTAVDVVLGNRFYDKERSKAFVWDLASDEIPKEIEESSIDAIVLIFVFSALSPNQWKQAVNNIYRMLKPGGLVLFRDYGRYDLAQLRFKKNRLLEENFYIRGDGTRVYFFTSEQVVELFDKFQVEQNTVDRRLIVNRQKKLKMQRVWLQCKFKKA